MNEVENKVGQALEHLIKNDFPKTAKEVIDTGCYIAPIVVLKNKYTKEIEQYVIIDFTEPLMYDTKEWTQYGLTLFNMFMDTKKWSHC